MKRVRRVDAGGTLAKPERLANGWLRVEGKTARAGILEYAEHGGKVRRELVLPEDLFEAESLASARMVPVTNKHPAALLDAGSAKAHQVGSVGENLRPEGDYLIAPLMVVDAEMIAAIEAGRSELSWGYDCDIDEAAGRHPIYGEYDAIQRRRRYNHLAIVDEARAGSEARIRLDAAGHACPPFAPAAAPVVASDPSVPNRTEIKPMPHAIKFDGLTFNIEGPDAPAIQTAIDRVLAQHAGRADAATTAKEAAEKKAADAGAKLDGFTKRVKAWVGGIRVKLDGMKARMMACDECAGSGKMMDGDAEKKCDYCDGAGSVRFHEAIKGMEPAAAEHPEEDLAAVEDDLSREPASEEALEKAANPAHNDAARTASVKARSDARAAARSKRADAMERRADQRAKERAALLTVAARHLGSEEKLDGLSDLEVRRKVVGKLAPHLDAAAVEKMDAAAIGLLFSAETKRADAAPAAPTFSPSDLLRAGALTPPAGPPAPPPSARVDASANAQRVENLRANAWKMQPAAK